MFVNDQNWEGHKYHLVHAVLNVCIQSLNHNLSWFVIDIVVVMTFALDQYDVLNLIFHLMIHSLKIHKLKIHCYKHIH